MVEKKKRRKGREEGGGREGIWTSQQLIRNTLFFAAHQFTICTVWIRGPWPSEQALLVDQMVKNLPAIQELQVRSLGREDRLDRKWQPNPVFLSGESHGQRNLAGYSPWGCKIIHDWVANTDWLTFIALNIALCSLEPSKRVKSGQDNMWPSLCLHFW